MKTGMKLFTIAVLCVTMSVIGVISSAEAKTKLTWWHLWGGSRAELIEKLAKPGKKASKEEKLQYEKRRAQNTPSVHGLRLLSALRAKLELAEQKRPLIVCGDSHYSTSKLLQGLPARTTYIGRIRGDANLFALPQAVAKGRPGRKPDYGESLPTPRELLRDRSVPWQKQVLPVKLN